MTVDELLTSATTDSQPPEGLSPEAEALWHTKAGDWEAAHNIAQDIHTPIGSWIHAHLHVIEGGGHLFLVTKADETIPVITDFLDTIDLSEMEIVSEGGVSAA